MCVGYIVWLMLNVLIFWWWVLLGDGDFVIIDVVMLDENIFDVLFWIKKMCLELLVLVMSV